MKEILNLVNVLKSNLDNLREEIIVEEKKHNNFLYKRKIEKLEPIIFGKLEIKLRKLKDRASVEIFYTGDGESILDNENLPDYRNLRKNYLVYECSMLNVEDIDKDKMKRDMRIFLEDLYNKELPKHERNLDIVESNKLIYDSIIEHLKDVGVYVNSDVKYSIRESFPNYLLNDLSNTLETHISVFNLVLNDMVSYLNGKYREWEEENKGKLLSDNGYVKDVKGLLNDIDNILNVEVSSSDRMLEDLKKYLLVNNILKAGYNLEYNRYFMENTDGANKAVEYLYDEINFFTSRGVKVDKLVSAVECIKASIEAFDGDGRIFRDMDYNFDELYNLIILYEKDFSDYIPLIKRLIQLEFAYRLDK